MTITLVDEYGASSNAVTVEITITGTNDAPTDLINNPDDSNPGDGVTVTESGFRVDQGHDFTIERGSLTNPAVATQAADTTIEQNSDADGNDVAGDPDISGVFDAEDIDNVGTSGVIGSAFDLHTFEIFGGSGASSRDNNVSLKKGDADIDTTDALYGTNPRLYNSESDDDITSSFKGVFGTLTVNRFTGAWDYILDNHDPDTILLDGGEPASDVFAINITDEEGAAVVKDFTITITGTDDAPLLTMDTGVDVEATEKGGTLNGAGGDIASGQFAVNDVDGDDGATFDADLKIQGRVGTSGNFTDGSNTANSNKGTSYTGAFGTLYLKADGSWSYEIDENHADVQALRPSSNALVDTFSVKIRNGDLDSNIITLTLSINGAEDAPTISAEITGDNNVTEDNSSDETVSGSVTVADVDTGHDKSNLIVYAEAGSSARSNVAASDTNADRIDIPGSGSSTTTIAGTYGNLVVTRLMQGM